MKHKLLIKLISVIAAMCLLFTTGTAVAADTSSLEKQRRELQLKLAETDKKLAELSEQSRDTEEYIDTLGDKISYLKKQYDYAVQEEQSIESKVAMLENSISDNEQKLYGMSKEATEFEQTVANLDAEFQDVYEQYCSRMRAIYISGQQGSIISFLLTSDSVSNFITRMQMVYSVSKQDAELLKKVQTQSDCIIKSKEELKTKAQEIENSQTALKNSKAELKTQRSAQLENQEKLAEQQAIIESQQKEQNIILQKLHNKTRKYGEFRDTTKEELEAIDADIAAADRKFSEPETTTKPTTEESTTGARAQQTTSKPAATQPKNDTISLTYPCPQYTSITCGFGDYEGHTGCDFSTEENENCRIVAAESGTVILVKFLEESYGHYIVIRHDKLSADGDPVYTLYAHNNDIVVSPGQYVRKGQQIAYSGTTGNSTGPHCHFEVRVGGPDQHCAQNPAEYLP